METIDFFTGQALKSNIGDISWMRFFALVSNEFARLEKRSLVPGTPEDKDESKSELQACSSQIISLEGLKAATATVGTGKSNVSTGQLFLLQLNLGTRSIRTTSFERDQGAEAQEKYLAAEKANKDNPDMQTVLVSVDSLAALRKAYPSYYLDIGEFVRILNKIQIGRASCRERV